MSNPHPNPPPVHGQWKPGQSGNPRGRPKGKPFQEALARLRAERAKIDDEIATVLAARALAGDMSAIKEWGDRADGKVTTPIESVNVTHIVSGWDE